MNFYRWRPAPDVFACKTCPPSCEPGHTTVYDDHLRLITLPHRTDGQEVPEVLLAAVSAELLQVPPAALPRTWRGPWGKEARPGQNEPSVSRTHTCWANGLDLTAPRPKTNYVIILINVFKCANARLKFLLVRSRKREIQSIRGT